MWRPTSPEHPITNWTIDSENSVRSVIHAHIWRPGHQFPCLPMPFHWFMMQIHRCEWIGCVLNTLCTMLLGRFFALYVLNWGAFVSRISINPFDGSRRNSAYVRLNESLLINLWLSDWKNEWISIHRGKMVKAKYRDESNQLSCSNYSDLFNTIANNIFWKSLYCS